MFPWKLAVGIFFRETYLKTIWNSVTEVLGGPLQAPVIYVVREYDLEVRTEQFAVTCRAFIRNLDRDLVNNEDCKQLTRSSGSVAANCLEANEAFSKKDRAFRFKVCRKEARESRLWLTVIYATKSELTAEKERLIDEATQLVKIFSTIIKRIGGTD